MSNIPSRTRSLRKPLEKSGDSNSTRIERPVESPSRLPVKPTTRPRPSSISSISGLTSNASTSMRPPPIPNRANISKPATSTTGLTRGASTRRPSSASTTSSGIDPAKVDRSSATRPPPAIARHLRHGSTSSVASSSTRVPAHTRHRSSSTLLTSATTLRPAARTTPEDPSARSQTAEAPQRKANFSTLQQHYSPAKNLAPKPHPAAFLVPPTPSKLPANIAITAETAKLQNELLQLHLLHKDASRVELEWRASAKRKLGQRFAEVVKENEGLVRLEEEEMGRINAAALKKWGDGWGLEEKTQALDSILTGVWNLGEPGAKYSRVVKKFARWITRVQGIFQARDSGDAAEIVFIEELDGSWRDECLILTRKLEGWRDQLRDLGNSDHGSNLETVLTGCRQLVAGMLDELNIMSKIEADAVRIEGDWIKSMNEDNSDDEDLPPVGAIWRR
ncbi:hypothetical protein PVAG01_02795 [Phlyctema vagabunda]|uniref:AGA1 A-agglutinin anchor subunit n=1 Tax=Phlyctema vagabunda TaxID=108571 RepID=A0ABR4PRM7_9HELO